MGSKDESKSLMKAKESVLRLLRYRLQSEREIREKLKRKKYSNRIIEKAVKYFKDVEEINDRQFAKIWIRSRLNKPYGLRRIAIELERKGVDPDIIEEELAAATEDYAEADIARQLALRRAQMYSRIEPVKRKQRIYGYLLRRGFSHAAVIKTIKGL